MSWFYKLRKDGATVSGSGTIAINDVAITPGHEPFWMTDDLIVYKGPGDVPTQYDIQTQKVDKLSTKQSSMIAAGGGEWQMVEGEKIWVSVSREGQRAWVIEHGGQNRDRSIFLNGFPIIEHAIVNYAMVQNDYVVWSRFEPREVWGRKSHGTPEKLTDGLFGVPVVTSQGMWVVVQTHTAYKVFDWETKLGYIIEVGNDQNLNPDALFINGKIEIVANAGNGEIRRTSVDLSQPRIPVNGVQPKPEEPKPEEPKPEEPMPTPVHLSQSVQNTIHAIWPKVAHLHQGSDDDRRAGTKIIIEQVVFNHPMQGFGWKASGPTNPPSKDAIARVVDGRLYYMDLVNGGTRELVDLTAAMGDITGQHFIAVEAVDHLTVVKPEEPKPEDPKPVPTPVCDCAKVKAEMIAAMADLAARMLQAMDDKIKALPTPVATLPKLKVVGNTSRDSWHSHRVDLKVVEDK